MKILFVCNEYPPFPFGGLGVFVKALGKALSSISGVEVYVLCMRDDISERNDIKDGNLNLIQYPLKNLRLKRLNMFYKALQQNRIIKSISKEKQIDIVEISSSENFYLLNYNYGAKLVVRTHGSIMYAIHNESRAYIGRLQKYFKLRHEKQIYKSADAIITISTKFHKWFSEKYGDKVIFVPNFLQDNFVRISAGKSNFDRPYIFHHGTLKEDKGTFDLVNAFFKSSLYKTHYLVLAGKISEKDRIRLESLQATKVLSIGVLNNDELKDYLVNADFSIYPSRRDAFNLCVIESMSQECLTVVSDVIDEGIIKDHKSGIRRKINDEFDVLRLIEDVILLPASRRKEIKQHGRAHVIEKFAPDVIIRNNLDLYQKISNNNSK